MPKAGDLSIWIVFYKASTAIYKLEQNEGFVILGQLGRLPRANLIEV